VEEVSGPRVQACLLTSSATPRIVAVDVRRLWKESLVQGFKPASSRRQLPTQIVAVDVRRLWTNPRFPIPESIIP
jgi:hypothetical protein